MQQLSGSALHSLLFKRFCISTTERTVVLGWKDSEGAGAGAREREAAALLLLLLLLLLLPPPPLTRDDNCSHHFAASACWAASCS
jgi:hypothetical protein